jgi:hypothetical protein
MSMATEWKLSEPVKQEADTLLGKIETAVGELRGYDTAHATLVADIVQAVNGLRTLLGVVRPH